MLAAQNQYVLIATMTDKDSGEPESCSPWVSRLQGHVDVLPILHVRLAHQNGS
jgi:hypothetical protein